MHPNFTSQMDDLAKRETDPRTTVGSQLHWALI